MELVEDEPVEFLKLWARLGKQFPSEYIEAPLYNTFGLWYLGGDSSCYMEYKMTISFDEKHHVELQSKLPAASHIIPGSRIRTCTGICQASA